MATPNGRGRRTAVDNTMARTVTRFTETSATTSCRKRLKVSRMIPVDQPSSLMVQMEPSSPDTASMTRVSPGVCSAASRSSTQLSTTVKETPRP
jgi:hypothetical protein